MGLEALIIQQAIERSKNANAAQEVLRDGKELLLVISPPNRKAPHGIARWFQRYRSPEDGARRKLDLGQYPAVSLALARKKAEAVRTEVGAGIDPILRHRRELATKQSRHAAEQAENEVRRVAAELEQQRMAADAARLAARMTVRSLFDRWQEFELSRRKDKGAEVLRTFTKDVFPVIGTMSLEDVRRGHVMGVLDPIVARGSNRMANRTLSDLRQMFGYAVVRDYMEIDPTARIKKSDVGGKDGERDRVLSQEEVRILAQRVPIEGQHHVSGTARLELSTQVAIWLMLSTMSRAGALSQMRWQDIDFEKRTWTIPDDHAKRDLGYVVHLSSFALDQLERIRSPREYARTGLVYAADPVWVFPATRKADALCLKTLQKQIADRQRTTPMSNRSKHQRELVLPGGRWTAHDLRRTGATIMGELGIRSEVIEKCLGHTEQNKMARIYQRAELLEERRHAFDALGQRLSLLTRNDAANVVLLPVRAA